MNTEELANAIIKEIESETGYILQLRIYNKYDEEALNRLLSLLEKYQISLSDATLINRKVASWLYAINGILQSLQSFYQSSSDSKVMRTDEALRKIDRATIKILNNPTDQEDI